MKIGQKALSLVLALAMLTGTLFSTAAFAAEEAVWDSNFDSGSIHYHVTDSNFTDKDSGSVEVTYVDSGLVSYDVPEQVTYQDSAYNVTAIAADAFDHANASGITAVIAGTPVSLAAEENGSVGLAAVENGAVTAKAIPAQDFKLDGWYQPDGEERVSAAASLPLTDDTGYDLVAKFKPVTFVSDTTYDFTVNGAYQIKITSKNGKAPVVAFGTGGVFDVKALTKSGDAYFYKITATGKTGAQAGLYVNGEKLLVATVGAGFVSDTTQDFTVKGSYQIKITSLNGKVPTFSVGTAGVFSAQFVKRIGSDYYYKLISIGAAGAKAGVYVNGQKILVATVGKITVKSDTTSSFQVKAGASYVFKLTADAKPSFAAGTASAFQVQFVKADGKDYFYKVTAVGSVGAASGFYINGDKTPVAVATVSK